MLGDAVTQIRIPTQVAESIIADLNAGQERIDAERKTEHDSASQRLAEIAEQKMLAYDRLQRGLIDESLWSSLRANWKTEELRLHTVLESISTHVMGLKIDSVRKTFELPQIVNGMLCLTLIEPNSSKSYFRTAKRTA
jgi:hypothetical protein